MNRIINIYKKIILSIEKLLYKQKKPSEFSEKIFFLKVNSIGDYILVRNFIKEVKNTHKYRNFKITLCGNIIWKNISEELDSNYVDNFIWIDIKKFRRNCIYRFFKISQIRKEKYEIALNPSTSRYFDLDDLIIRAVIANKKIGYDYDLNNSKEKKLKETDTYYTSRYTVPEKIKFEFQKNKYFFEKTLDKRIDIIKPTLNIKRYHKFEKINYFVISLGAQNDFRIWSPKNYAVLCNLINNIKDKTAILIGSPNEIGLGEIFEKNCKTKKVINLIGKVDLIHIPKIIKGASFFIGNESAGTHIATALDVKTFCISNGNHFGRFNPYPESMQTKTFYIYPDNIEKDFDKAVIKYSKKSELDINSINPDKVFDIIKNNI